MLCDVMKDAGSAVQHHHRLQLQKRVQEVRVPREPDIPSAAVQISTSDFPFLFFFCLFLFGFADLFRCRLTQTESGFRRLSSKIDFLWMLSRAEQLLKAPHAAPTTPDYLRLSRKRHMCRPCLRITLHMLLHLKYEHPSSTFGPKSV